jgi:hypothetical protein
MVQRGDWIIVHPQVLRAAAANPDPQQRLLAAVLAAGPGALASHESAAWLWDLAPEPSCHSLMVARTSHPEVKGATVHRPRLPPGAGSVSFRAQIPCTNPLRTLVDLSEAVAADELDDAA